MAAEAMVCYLHQNSQKAQINERKASSFVANVAASTVANILSPFILVGLFIITKDYVKNLVQTLLQ